MAHGILVRTCAWAVFEPNWNYTTPPLCRSVTFMNRLFRDITGVRFNRLVVISRVNNDKHGNSRWKCLCDCGNTIEVLASCLRKLECQSCGCYHKEVAKITVLKRVKHGEARQGKATREYTTWQAMKRRCYAKNDKFYDYYGGRGIKVCDRWLNSYESFLLDMGRRPSDSHSLDRIDPNGNYEPRNCRWATNKEQNRNKRYEQTLYELIKVKQLLARYVEKYGELDDAS